MNRLSLIALLALGLASTVALAAGPRPVDTARSTLGFAGVADGEAFTGRFGRFDAEIVFDPAALDAARFDVRIALASADTANPERDATLKGAEFFNVAAAPEARYTATRFRALDDGRFAADGTLTLNGATQPVTLTFRWTPDGDGAVLDGSATLDRLAFNVGGGDWADDGTIRHAVDVTTTLHLGPAP